MKKKLFNRKGFTLIELLAVVLIIGILVTVGAVAISTAIDKTNRTKVDADFREFMPCITYSINSDPQIIRKTGYQNADVLYVINSNLEPELQIDLSHCGSDDNLLNGGSNLSSIKDITQSTIVASKYLDPWGTPYRFYVQANDLALTGENSKNSEKNDAELRVFVISNGPNTISGKTVNLLDKDDIVAVVECVNGSMRIGYFNTSNTNSSDIFWFLEDIRGFDKSKALDTSAPDTVLNMNCACLEVGEPNDQSTSES